MRPLVRTVNYLAIVWPALVFGVLIGAAVRALSALAARYVRESKGSVEACPLETTPPHGIGGVLTVFAEEAWRMARSTLPIIVLGVILSSFLLELVPFQALGTMSLQIAVVALVALVSVPLALPTFAEIPLGLGLLAAGAPAGAVVALLVAGPAINLPSLLTVSRMTTPRYALALAVGTFAVAVAGGLLVQSI